MISLSWRRCAREMMMCDHHVGWESCQQYFVQTQAGGKLDPGGLCSYGAAYPLVGGLKRTLDRGLNADLASGVLAFLDRLVGGPDLDELLQLQRSLAAHCNLNLLISRCQRKRWGK